MIPWGSTYKVIPNQKNERKREINEKCIFSQRTSKGEPTNHYLLNYIMKQQIEEFYLSINSNAVKKQEGAVFLELRELIDLHDPMDLGKYGAESEYDPETASILIQLIKELTKEDIHELVLNDFKYWFDPIVVKKEQIKDLADAIYNWMKKAKLNNLETE